MAIKNPEARYLASYTFLGGTVRIDAVGPSWRVNRQDAKGGWTLPSQYFGKLDQALYAVINDAPGIMGDNGPEMLLAALKEFRAECSRQYGGIGTGGKDDG